jgi:hypothetical protein
MDDTTSLLIYLQDAIETYGPIESIELDEMESAHVGHDIFAIRHVGEYTSHAPG